jgi:protein ImuB
LPAVDECPAVVTGPSGEDEFGELWSWPDVPALDQKKLWICIIISQQNIEIKEKNNEERGRNGLARWALGYTPVVSLDAEDALLLEVAGSLRLFGGLQSLRMQLERDLAERGVCAMLACAPLPRAALWLARAGNQQACADLHGLGRLLADVPVSVTGWPVSVQQKLRQMGVHTLSACRRLPRDGFARRIGRRYLHALDEAFGRRQQLLSCYEPPLYFSDRLELDAETLDQGMLLDAVAFLLEKLDRFLRHHQACTQVLYLRLVHGSRTGRVSGHAEALPVTELQVCSGDAVMQTGRFIELTALQLERRVLPEPVTAVVLESGVIPGASISTMGLPGIQVPPGSDDPSGPAQLVAKLRARLGTDVVHRLIQVAEHRPEHAWQVAEPGASYSVDVRQGQLRPLWLLTEPQPIASPDKVSVPLFQSAERIESGWWDGYDVRRDYYQVPGPFGSLWWVYRDCRDACWYLHGLFG